MAESQPSEIFRERLKNARDKLREWSQAELATKAGLPPTSIAHFEAGARKPSLKIRRFRRGCTEN